MNELVTIIVPVYNAEKNLGRCISSIHNQTYKNLEIIFINDGSKDKSLDILNEYVQKDNRIQVVSQENKGVSATRNLGIELSKGDFLYFMDADDEIEPKVVETLYTAIKDNSDLVISNYKIGEINNLKANKIEFVGNFEKQDFLRHLDSYYLNNFLNAVWNKFFKKEIIHKYKISFEKNINMGEDILFILEYLKYSKRINILNTEHNYRYLDNADSLTKKTDLKYFKMYEIIYSRLQEYLAFEGYNNEDMLKVFNRMYGMSNVGLINKFFFENSINKENIKKIHNLANLSKVNTNYLGLKSRVFLKIYFTKNTLLLKIFFIIYKTYLNLTKP